MFLEEGLRTSLPRRFAFRDDEKILDLARRGGTEFNLTGGRKCQQAQVSRQPGCPKLISGNFDKVWYNIAAVETCRRFI
jgi:hypothetical protein